MIRSKELQPGEKIVQEKIAEMLGVSRTPLMKALQKLEHENFLISIPHKGMYVRKVSLSEMIDLYYCRESIECMATRLTTLHADSGQRHQLKAIFDPFIDTSEAIDVHSYQKGDEAFHDTLIAYCQNPMLQKMSIMSQVQPQVYHIGLLRSPKETLQEHQLIIDAILAKDAAKAEEGMRIHIQKSRDVLIQHAKDQGEIN